MLYKLFLTPDVNRFLASSALRVIPISPIYFLSLSPQVLVKKSFLDTLGDLNAINN